LADEDQGHARGGAQSVGLQDRHGYASRRRLAGGHHADGQQIHETSHEQQEDPGRDQEKTGARPSAQRGTPIAVDTPSAHSVADLDRDHARQHRGPAGAKRGPACHEDTRQPDGERRGEGQEVPEVEAEAETGFRDSSRSGSQIARWFRRLERVLQWIKTSHPHVFSRDHESVRLVLHSQHDLDVRVLSPFMITSLLRPTYLVALRLSSRLSKHME
jgi:hypothetical protein